MFYAKRCLGRNKKPVLRGMKISDGVAYFGVDSDDGLDDAGNLDNHQKKAIAEYINGKLNLTQAKFDGNEGEDHYSCYIPLKTSLTKIPETVKFHNSIAEFLGVETDKIKLEDKGLSTDGISINGVLGQKLINELQKLQEKVIGTNKWRR